MRIAVTIIGCILILPGVFIVATNWYCYIRWHLTQLRNPRSKCSDGTVLLLGGLMLSVGLVCLIDGLNAAHLPSGMPRWGCWWIAPAPCLRHC